ncbi:hypothetical protein TNCV_1772561 [Trichonephila clavipes]|nr:hypothetical protein TNCV_1772561 [Trichonephila clavipes]
MLRKGRYKTSITSVESLLHQSSTTGKMMVQNISREKCLIDAAVFQKESRPSESLKEELLTLHEKLRPFLRKALQTSRNPWTTVLEQTVTSSVANHQ